MTILQELARYYERKDELPRLGYSTESVGGEVVLSADGEVVEINPLMAADDKGRMRPRRMIVPAALKRSSGIMPFLFWDKSAYVLGVTAQAGEGGKPLSNDNGDAVPGQGKRTAEEHAAFVAVHLEMLEGMEVPGLVALRRFLESWDWAEFAAVGYPAQVIDQNLVFRLDGERRFLHDLPEVAALITPDEGDSAICLVSGEEAPVARLHPSIKGVLGAQSSGASLVSFNELAYESHGKKQGGNAPVSGRAAFAYGTALNALLARGSGQSLRIGDATVVFWAQAATPEAAAAADPLFGAALAPEDDDAAQNKLSGALHAIAKGQWDRAPEFDPETRLFMLGLAPNAARLSVRFWHTLGLEDFAARIVAFHEELEIAPSPWIGKDGKPRPPAAWRLLSEVAVLGEAKTIPPLLGGALMRAVLTGSDYPRTLLAGVVARIRAESSPRDKFQDGRRASIIRAVLTRNTKREVPMALDETAEDEAYLLGRLFGAYFYAERSYAARGTTIRDKYLGSASANPTRVFPVLMRGYEHNRAGLTKAGGQKAGSGVRADKAVAQILSLMPGDGNLPAALPLEDQSRFFVGFYHQLSSFYAKAEDAVLDASEETEE